MFVCTLLYHSRVQLEEVDRLSCGGVFEVSSVCFQLIVCQKFLCKYTRSCKSKVETYLLSPLFTGSISSWFLLDCHVEWIMLQDFFCV